MNDNLSTPRPDRAYPVPLEGDEDSRFTVGLTLDVAEILKAHDFPPLGALDVVALRQALFRFVYGGARTGYMAEPGQPCDRARQGGER